MHARCQEKGMSIRKEDVRIILSTLDPEGTERRRSRRLSRRAYFAKGPNFIWHVDSYDKLKPFGICINGAIDGFSRRMLWLNAYCTSSDPKVVGGYYLETAQELGGCARIVRTDMGTENCSIRDMQRHLRRNDTDAHGGERSFMYGRSTSNQRIESWWGFLRKECVDFWLGHFHRLKDEGDFVGDFLDKNLMLFCFLALIQDDLDLTKNTWNHHLIRPSKNVHVPHGRPDAMYTIPELYGTEDYLCPVAEEDLGRCEEYCTHRHVIACDDDLFILCTSIMAEKNFQVPGDAYMAIDLYLSLRSELIRVFDLDRVPFAHDT
ncbi:hypothetical protein PBY51_019572 [Eleginops maclovinus]|nr:hypothetical protein PBY51_019572 [Eleginops maclovinus]